MKLKVTEGSVNFVFPFSQITEFAKEPKQKTMKINLVAFGIAKDILGKNTLEIKIEKGNTVGAVRTQLGVEYPEFKALKSLAFAVNEEYQTDDFLLKEGDEVVLIPPVSGG